MKHAQLIFVKLIERFKIMQTSTMSTTRSGNKIWKNRKGELHRLDGPAIEFADGTLFWYQNNRLHRSDGPAIQYHNGKYSWWYDGSFLGSDIEGFFALWECLDEVGRLNLNLHQWINPEKYIK